MAATARDVRLGHAFRSVPATAGAEDLAEVVKIIRGEQSLVPRVPSDPEAVNAAEQMLNVPSGAVYTFAGCLHPKLGTIGLVITPECVPRCLHGVSRCDTGGLAGRRGAFKYIEEGEVERVLATLTCTNGGWGEEFSSELTARYDSIRLYVAGEKPRHEDWDDPRARCIASHLADKSQTEPLDRRLWTWEVRLGGPPQYTEYEALILSPEAYKKLDHLQRTGTTIPECIRIVRGRVEPDGVHHFHEEATIDALCGGGSRERN